MNVLTHIYRCTLHFTHSVFWYLVIREVVIWVLVYNSAIIPFNGSIFFLIRCSDPKVFASRELQFWQLLYDKFLFCWSVVNHIEYVLPGRDLINWIYELKPNVTNILVNILHLMEYSDSLRWSVNFKAEINWITTDLMNITVCLSHNFSEITICTHKFCMLYWQNRMYIKGFFKAKKKTILSK